MSLPAFALFTTPKPFLGHAGIIQRNAIQSWSRLAARPEIIVFGTEEGAGDIAAEVGGRHVAQVARSDGGMPLLDDLFALAERHATAPIMVYVNADIILLDDFAAALERVAAWRARFLMIGQRMDVDITEPLDFADGWQGRLRDLVATKGSLQSPDGIDYFAFPRGTWDGGMPPLIVARTIWDIWLLGEARRRGCSMVDATDAVLAIHQNHDYSNVAGGKVAAWTGPEAQRNRLLAGGYSKTLTIRDSAWRLTRDRVARAVRNYPHRLYATAKRLAQAVRGR